ncbi:recombinase family protein [Nocardia niigatensis]
MSFKRLHQMLQDPYYAGWINYEGELYPGRHEPIVPQELFDRVQDVMDMRSRPGQRDRVLQHYLKGGLFCFRCERADRTARLIYTEAKGRNGTRYGYFLCRGRQEGLCDLPHLPAEQVEQAIVDHYRTLQLPTAFTADARALLDEILSEEQSSLREMHRSLKLRLAELDAKEERLIDLTLDDALPKEKITRPSSGSSVRYAPASRNPWRPPRRSWRLGLTSSIKRWIFLLTRSSCTQIAVTPFDATSIRRSTSASTWTSMVWVMTS